MENKKPQLTFLLVALAVTLVLSFFIFKPFLYTLILAVIFAVIFQTPYQKILKFTHQRQGLAALLTTIIVVLFILIPSVFLGMQIVQESRQIYFSLSENGNKDAIVNVLRVTADNIQEFFPSAKNLSLNMDEYLKQGTMWLLQNLSTIFSNIAKILIDCFIFLVAFYYLLKEGQALKKLIINLSPLANANDETVFKKLELAINSVIRGNFIIALIQGILTSIGLAIFGVPNAVLWGTVAAISSLIPGIGTSLVIIPAIIFLFLSGNIASTIGLIIWGMAAVGLIDNFLGPKIVGRSMQLHPLLVILAVLGGVAFFGPIGFLLGPLSMSLFFALLDIYVYLFKSAEIAK